VRRHRGLLAAALLAIVCGLVAVLVPWQPVRIVAALPLTLFLPGYALTAAIFGTRQLDRAREIVLGLAVSLALLALGSILLSAVGIYPGTWALLLAVFTVAGCAVGMARRGPERRREPRDGPRRRLRRRDGAILLAATALGAVAIVLTQVSFDAGDADGYTALWMLPGHGGKSVEVGVASAQHTPWSYVLDVHPHGSRPIVESFQLRPGDEKILRLRLPVRADGRPLKVTASLYREGAHGEPYRRVVNWVSPREPS